MGSTSSCNPAPPADQTFDAVASVGAKCRDWSKAYKWYGIHILTAKCKSDDTVYYEKQINIMGLIVVGMVSLLVLFLIFKMMHHSSAMNQGYPM